MDRPDDPKWDWRKTYWHGHSILNTHWGWVDHLRVERHDGKDGIPWEVLQRIKNDILGKDTLAVEVYPPQDKVVNRSNTRHLWVMRDPFQFQFLGNLGDNL